MKFSFEVPGQTLVWYRDHEPVDLYMSSTALTHKWVINQL